MLSKGHNLIGLDLSPDRKFGALVATQKLPGERFNLVLLHTWSNDYSINDLAVANDIAPYVRKYNVQTVAYSKRTAQAIASRLVPAGIFRGIIDSGGNGQSPTGGVECDL